MALKIYLAGPEVFFPNSDNLMIEGAIKHRLGVFLTLPGDNLAVFEQVLVQIKIKLSALAGHD